jgi:hypothetical protein
MKKSFMSLLLALAALFATAQTNWVTKKVGYDNVHVTFPSEPSHDEKPQIQSEIYVSAIGNCMFTVLVKKNVLPNAIITNYEKFKTLSETEQSNLTNEFLDKGIRQFVGNSSIISPSKSIRVGKYLGKEITYENSNSGITNQLFTKFLLVGKNLYIIQCTYKKPSNPCRISKEKFLSSVSIY